MARPVEMKSVSKVDYRDPMSTKQTITADQRWSMIQVTAYLTAEKSGFLGDPVQYWLNAEREVDNNLKGKTRTTRPTTN